MDSNSRNKMVRQLAKLNRKIKTVTNEIEILSLIQDNQLQYGVYKDFVNRKIRTENKRTEQNANLPNHK